MLAMKARIMAKMAEPGESLGMRTLVWLAEHPWVLVVVIYGGCLAIGLGVWWLAAQGWGDVLIWVGVAAGVIIAGLIVHVVIDMWILTRQPLPALDRTARTATVVLKADDAEHRMLLLQYTGADGEAYNAQLADYIDDSWEEAFAPGSEWQVYAFRDPHFADTVVFLTEAHDEVCRSGYVLDDVRIGGESGPVKRGPGSPFLNGAGKWKFEP